MESEVSEVERVVGALYGPGALIERGVVHVTSAIRADERRLHVIKIGEHAPRSATDFSVLNLCRARADVILTTAANLRAEPQLQHALQGPMAHALSRYRRSTLGKAGPPVCAILTRGGELPDPHPVWEDGTRKLVLTGPQTAAALRAQLGARAEVVGLELLDAHTASGWLKARGYGLISVEAGPSAAAALYGPDSVVDELLLSLYEGEASPACIGPALPEDGALLAGRVLSSSVERQEESGRWRFQRWAR